MSTAAPVAVIGDILIDEMNGPFGSAEAPGGSALNVAVGMAVLGVPVTLIGMVGDDSAGTTLRNHLTQHGVALVATAAPLGTGRAISDRTHGEPVYSFNDASRNRTLRLDDGAARALDAARLVVVSGFPFDDAAEVAVLSAACAGKRLIVDANPRAGMMRDRAAFATAFTRMAASCELVKLGDEDAALLFGETAEQAGERLLSQVGARTAVLATMGARGATVMTASGSISVPIVDDDRPVVDTLGAGDAVFATVAAELAQRAVPATSGGWAALLQTAMRVAAETIRYPGGLLRLPPSAKN